MQIRLLTADEIECKAITVKKNTQGYFVQVALYKDARCDMNILDETFGPFGWQRTHQEINGAIYCTLSIFDEEHGRWIQKQDVGAEGSAAAGKEKGQASDSFKRACVNVGIGRELYTAPKIWIQLEPSEVKSLGNDKYTTYVRFDLIHIEYVDRKISSLVIQDNNNKVRYVLNAPEYVLNGNSGRSSHNNIIQFENQTTSTTATEIKLKSNKGLTDRQLNRLYVIARQKGFTEEQVIKASMKHYNVEDMHTLSREAYDELCNGYAHIEAN